MPIHTHYQNITCLTLLSWPMVTTIVKYIKCIPISEHMYGAAYNTYAPTPPKSFHPSVKKTHKLEEENIGITMEKEMSTQNREKNERICSIRTIGTT